MRGILTKLFAASAIALMGLAASVQADESKIPEPFRGETQSSPISINYDDWSDILKATVLDSGMSDRSLASAPRAETGTRITRGNSSITRHEGNRLMFPAFADNPANLKIVHDIRKDLEGIPDQVPMKEWTEKEQLAYWLNLYNITMIEMLSAEYPVTSLKGLMKGSKKNPSLWDRKELKVAGVDLSLNDIHQILIEKWDSTLVMYGLFQGYVGSPNIPRKAYTAQTVHSMLVENAREFVNSNRGMRFNGDTLLVSELYKENKKLFPDWNEDLKKHFVSLTDPGLHSRIRSAKKIKASTADYYIADLMEGTKVTTSATNTNSAALMSAEVHVHAGLSEVGGGAEAGVGIGNFDMLQFADLKQGRPNDMRFPPQAVKYIQHIMKKRSLQEGKVDVEELDNANEESSPN